MKQKLSSVTANSLETPEQTRLFLLHLQTPSEAQGSGLLGLIWAIRHRMFNKKAADAFLPIVVDLVLERGTACGEENVARSLAKLDTLRAKFIEARAELTKSWESEDRPNLRGLDDDKKMWILGERLLNHLAARPESGHLSHEALEAEVDLMLQHYPLEILEKAEANFAVLTDLRQKLREFQDYQAHRTTKLQQEMEAAPKRLMEKGAPLPRYQYTLELMLRSATLDPNIEDDLFSRALQELLSCGHFRQTPEPREWSESQRSLIIAWAAQYLHTANREAPQSSKELDKLIQKIVRGQRWTEDERKIVEGLFINHQYIASRRLKRPLEVNLVDERGQGGDPGAVDEQREQRDQDQGLDPRGDLRQNLGQDRYRDNRHRGFGNFGRGFSRRN